MEIVPAVLSGKIDEALSQLRAMVDSGRHLNDIAGEPDHDILNGLVSDLSVMKRQVDTKTVPPKRTRSSRLHRIMSEGWTNPHPVRDLLSQISLDYMLVQLH